MEAAFFLNRPKFRPSLGRTVAFLCATLLLHYFLFESVGTQTWHTQRHTIENVPLSVQLRTTDDSPRQVSPIGAVNTRKPKQEANKDRTIQHNSVEKNDPLVEKHEETKVEVQEANSVEPVSEVKDEPVQTQEAEKFSLRLPPSADMTLDVSYAKVNASPTHGVGNLYWSATSGSYSIALEVRVDLFLTTINLLQLTSDGLIGENGLMPSMSTDTRRNRASTAIHFNHKEKSILFSSSNKTITMEDGAQDAISVLMQLASIGNSDPKQLSQGKEINIQVAEGRDAAIFTFQVLEDEELDSVLAKGGGKLRTVHLLRPPRPGSYNSTLEIWLAPELSWYPVQIRNTESSGTVTNQRVVAISQKERGNQ